MDSKEFIQSLVDKSRVAQKQIEHCTQEQADNMARAVGKIVFDHAEILAKEGTEETCMGTVEYKQMVHYAIGGVWRYLRGKKSVGILEDDPINHVVTIAKPLGVIGCVLPSTSPSAVPAIKVMLCLKSRNSAILAPHPRSKKTTTHTVRLMWEALDKLGAPRDLIQIIEEPTIELTGALMSAVDVAIATGGAGMVQAAYSSGKPSFGVGQGNVQLILDKDYQDIGRLVQNTISSRVFEYGVFCTGEQVMYLPQSRKDEVLNAFEAAGNHVLRDTSLLGKMRALIFPENGPINRDVVGISASKVAAMLGLSIPAETPLLVFPLEKYGEDEVLCREIMFPAVRYIVYDDFKDAVAMAKANLLVEGAGHTACIYSTKQDQIVYAGEQLPVGRLVVEQSGGGGAGAFDNGLPPTCSVGCGSWGNNSICENLSFEHLLNVTKISYLLPDFQMPSQEEIWKI